MHLKGAYPCLVTRRGCSYTMGHKLRARIAKRSRRRNSGPFSAEFPPWAWQGLHTRPVYVYLRMAATGYGEQAAKFALLCFSCAVQPRKVSECL